MILNSIVNWKRLANNTAMQREKNALEEIHDVLEFWFGRGQTATEVADEKAALWWSKNHRIDREITDRFAATSEAAANGELAPWAESPRGLLALIICTDQFPRNMHRDTRQSFSRDPAALGFAKQCVVGGTAQQLRPIERVFAYLPFEHSEALAEQQRSIALYRELAESAAPDETELFNGYLEFARKHYEIIERFGRFPHRNRILGRRATDEELAFLEQPDSSF